MTATLRTKRARQVPEPQDVGRLDEPGRWRDDAPAQAVPGERVGQTVEDRVRHCRDSLAVAPCRPIRSGSVHRTDLVSCVERKRRVPVGGRRVGGTARVAGAVVSKNVITIAIAHGPVNATPCPAFANSTKVPFGKRSATSRAASAGVTLSRSPFITSVGARGPHGSRRDESRDLAVGHRPAGALRRQEKPDESCA